LYGEDDGKAGNSNGANVVADKYDIYYVVYSLDEHAEKHGYGQLHQQPTDAVSVKYVMALVLHSF
jgi:hypothetical protein